VGGGIRTADDAAQVFDAGADKVSVNSAALKNPKLNPYKLANPYDGLANSLHRWKTVANDAVLSHYTDEQKKTIASHYYDRMIAPMYGGMKIAPMSKELWLKQAYGEATNYNIEDAYNNSIMHSLAHGWNEGLPGLARAGQYVHNALGNFVEDAVQLYKNQTAFRALPDAQQKVLLARPWHEQAQSQQTTRRCHTLRSFRRRSAWTIRGADHADRADIGIRGAAG